MDNMQKAVAVLLLVIIVGKIGNMLMTTSTPVDKLPLPPNYVSEGFESEQSGNIIGMIYPPRLGPLHTNFVMPDDKDSCNSPYATIYENKVVFNNCLPAGR
jgi:hypothetical protein